MRTRTVVWLFVCAAVTLGCEKADKPKQPEPVGEGVAPQKKVEAKPVPKPATKSMPEKPGPEVAQCEQILDRGWRSIQPVLDRLQIEKTDLFESRYKKSARNFLMRCQKLAPDIRNCLSQSENPYLAIDSCRANDNRKVSERLFPPNLRSHIKLLTPEPLPAAKGKKLLASLRGRWVNRWKAAKTKTTWKIGRQGKVSETIEGQKKKRKRDFKISFADEGRMRVEWNPTSSQPFAFFKPNRKTFYATGNLVYGFYPMPNKKSFVVKNSGDYIFWEDGKCQVISSSGVEVSGQCKFTRRNKETVFQVRYQFPGRKTATGKPRTDLRTYHAVGKYLLHESLVAAGKFVRK